MIGGAMIVGAAVATSGATSASHHLQIVEVDVSTFFAAKWIVAVGVIFRIVAVQIIVFFAAGVSTFPPAPEDDAGNLSA